MHRTQSRMQSPRYQYSAHVSIKFDGDLSSNFVENIFKLWTNQPLALFGEYFEKMGQVSNRSFVFSAYGCFKEFIFEV